MDGHMCGYIYTLSKEEYVVLSIGGLGFSWMMIGLLHNGQSSLFFLFMSNNKNFISSIINIYKKNEKKKTKLYLFLLNV